MSNREISRDYLNLAIFEQARNFEIWRNKLEYVIYEDISVDEQKHTTFVHILVNFSIFLRQHQKI